MAHPILLIDPHNGSVHLPDGGEISPDLTLDAFEADSSFARDRTVSSGVPWWGYDFTGGAIDGKSLLVSVHFYLQTLLSVDLTASHYQRDQKDLSEKTEAAAKDFHDALLERIFGLPHKTTVAPSSFPDRYPSLNRTLEWIFPWGTASSLFVCQSCSARMAVRYGNRWEEAHALDRRRHVLS
jgi:hypothetical protein